MADISAFGYGLVIVGVGLIPLFVYLRNHADKFRDTNASRVAAIRSRLANELVLNFLTRSVNLIDQLLGSSPEFENVRTRLADSLRSEETDEGGIQELRAALETSPPTPEDSRRVRQFTENLLQKFEARDDVSKSYDMGWRGEHKCAHRILALTPLLVLLGLILLGAPAFIAVTENDAASILIFAMMGAVLAYGIVQAAVDGFRSYESASEAQEKFLEFVTSELYEPPEEG